MRARGDIAGGIGPSLRIRVNGRDYGSAQVTSTAVSEYRFQIPAVATGASVDIIYDNDGSSNGKDRNLYITSIQQGSVLVLPNDTGVSYDRGAGSSAFDGIDVIPGQGEMFWNGALRLSWPSLTGNNPTATRRYEASRLLQQATFGPTLVEIDRLAATTPAQWIDEQMAMPFTADCVPYVQSMLDKGPSYLPSNNNQPSGANYTTAWPLQAFWRAAVTRPDQLRRRVGFALQQIFVLSTGEGSLWRNTRPAAQYYDTLNKDAFGNFRTLLEDVALSPAMGLYLSHIRNEPEDPAQSRSPDENFAREVMQLFTIGLVELNIDGTPKLDTSGNPIETYSMADVQAMARVFTGWSWGLKNDADLTETNFRKWSPDYTTVGSSRVDLRPMRNYPGFHSMSAKRLFAGKPHENLIPANTNATDSLRMALDTLFKHPNVGPFIGRQLIQHLVTSNPSPAYVRRVAQIFNNNGRGARGDMAAVVRAVLLDTEARAAPGAGFGRLRDPVLRVTHWMRAFGATSSSGRFMLDYDLSNVGQRPLNSPSVFNFFRPGYVPPNTTLAEQGLVAPAFQIANESTVAAWVNQVEAMVTDGIGWNGSSKDVTASMTNLQPIAAQGPQALADHMNLMIFAGRMSGLTRDNIVEAVGRVSSTTSNPNQNRARVATFLSLSSPEYLIQR